MMVVDGSTVGIVTILTQQNENEKSNKFYRKVGKNLRSPLHNKRTRNVFSCTSYPQVEEPATLSAHSSSHLPPSFGTLSKNKVLEYPFV